MKNDFETFYNSIHDEELEEIWKNAKKEKKKNCYSNYYDNRFNCSVFFL